jgi:hypothetical protein
MEEPDYIEIPLDNLDGVQRYVSRSLIQQGVSYERLRLTQVFLDLPLEISLSPSEVISIIEESR